MNPAAPAVAPECYPCVVGQALRTAQAAGLSPSAQVLVLEEALRGLRRRTPGWGPLQIGRKVADRATRLSGRWIDHDLYAGPKDHSNRVALSWAPQLRREIEASPDPLATAIRVAAAGNIIDFGAKDHSTLDLERECEEIATRPFGFFDLDPFRERLDAARDLLYICDNAGEIVFDVLLMETLARIRPGLRIHAALRERPILNDAVVDDAAAIGMGRIARLLSSGSVYGGTPLPECSEEFRSLYANADIVLGKGQGNFSSLRPHVHDRLFFCLRVKCPAVARATGQRIDSLQFALSTRF